MLKQFEQAWYYAEKGRQSFEQMGNQAFYAITLYEESIILKLTGQTASALELGQASLALMISLQDEFNRVYCLHHLGDLYQRLNQPTEAQQLWQEGYTLARSIHHPYTPYFEQALNLTPAP